MALEIYNICAAIGIALTFIASVYSAYYARKSTNSQNYVNAITKVRYEWGTALRKNAAMYFSTLDYYCNNVDKESLKNLTVFHYELLFLLFDNDAVPTELLAAIYGESLELLSLSGEPKDNVKIEGILHNIKTEKIDLFKHIRYLIEREWSKQKKEAVQ
ncbi:MAG: hypothetical protein LBC69_02150 [Eubacteriaceae bacterium]|jgi:hypothetical protein|nr:hypothetical protein [Eubacteriaceae bacterium]